MDGAETHLNPALAQTLPLRRLTLYKHGVAFVEREGKIEGTDVRLVVRANEVNDALKSLLAIERGGGQVLGAHYDTPGQAGASLAGNPIKLSDDHSLRDLLRGLRGWMVRLVTGDGAARETFSGRLLGIDRGARHGSLLDPVVSLVEDTSGTVRTVPLGQLREIVVVEERPRDDLRYFLDASRGQEAQCTITVRLSPGDHDLAVSYLVPSPAWRVSYRLVAEQDNTPDQHGMLLLQGWGLFDNPLQEDLRDVQVTLVAGQPISFVYDLATSRVPPRPIVQDDARIAPGPVEFAAALPQAMPAQAGSAMALLPQSAPAPVMMAHAARRAPTPSIAEMTSQTVEAIGGEAGELFQYEVVAPVSAGRGESSLAPILSAQLPYARELLYNQAKLAKHPVAALRFTNQTGLVLERGPVTVLENGMYRGEAMVPFVKDGGEIYLAFAVELGITITPSSGTETHTDGISIAGGLLYLQQIVLTETTYRIHNTLAASQVVTIEHAIVVGTELADTTLPAARTAEFYRWAVSCEARADTTFRVREQRRIRQSGRVLDQSYQVLDDYLRHHWLAPTIYTRLKALLDEHNAISRLSQQMDTLAAERQDIYHREDQLRQNLTALSPTGDERALRRRVVGELEACEERLASIQAEITALKDDSTRRQDTLNADLATLAVTP